MIVSYTETCIPRGELFQWNQLVHKHPYSGFPKASADIRSAYQIGTYLPVEFLQFLLNIYSHGDGDGADRYVYYPLLSVETHTLPAKDIKLKLKR